MNKAKVVKVYDSSKEPTVTYFVELMQKDTIIGVAPVTINLKDYERYYFMFNTARTFREDPITSFLYVPTAYESRKNIVLENILFRSENDSLKAKLLELEEENARLNKENEQLKRQVAKLSKTSKNSSKPPSSDIVKGKKNKNGKKKKRGGQPGHPKHERPQFPKDKVNKFYEYTLESCPDCSGTLRPCDDKEPIIIQQIEIIEIPIVIEEHKGNAYWCDNCQKVHYAPIPEDIVKAGLCGPGLTALVGYMKSSLHASFSTIRKFLRDVVKISISRGQLSKLITKVGNALDAPYNELLDIIPLEAKVNVDETGHKENGDKFWTWCFRAELYVLFKIDKSRGSKVLIEVLGKEFDGLLGCDYFSAYRKYMKDFNVIVQFCIAHLIRDIRYLTTLTDAETRAYGEKLLELLRKMFEIIRNSDKNTEEETKNQLGKIREKIIEIGINEAPSKLDENGKETRRDAQNVANRFRKFGASYFQFITTPEIDPTNNIAEQAIRFVVIDRYITQGTRSIKGRKNCERLWTVLATCTLQGRSAYQFIKIAVEAYFQNKSPPSLLPTKS